MDNSNDWCSECSDAVTRWCSGRGQVKWRTDVVAEGKSNDLVGDNGRYILRSYTHFTVHFRNFQWLVGAQSFVTLGWVIICDFKFKRTENHNFTITANTNQHVEFFHSLIFVKIQFLDLSRKVILSLITLISVSPLNIRIDIERYYRKTNLTGSFSS